MDLRIERDEGDGKIAGIAGDAGFACAEHGVVAGEATDGRTTAAGRTMETRPAWKSTSWHLQLRPESSQTDCVPDPGNAGFLPGQPAPNFASNAQQPQQQPLTPPNPELNSPSRANDPKGNSLKASNLPRDGSQALF